MYSDPLRIKGTCLASFIDHACLVCYNEHCKRLINLTQEEGETIYMVMLAEMNVACGLPINLFTNTFIDTDRRDDVDKSTRLLSTINLVVAMFSPGSGHPSTNNHSLV